MRIWVTRTAPENAKTAAKLRDLGHEPVCVPVLDVRPTPAEPPLTPPHAIVFTSINGVRHHPRQTALVDIPVFAVGDRTAAAAVRAGYADVRSANGDVFALQRLIREQLPAPGRLVHFGARDVAGDLRAMLRRFGYLVDRRVVYAAHSVALRWLLQVRNGLGSIDGIVVHSPRAADRVARVLAGTTWRGKVWCISEACARRFAGMPGVLTRHAAQPNEAALLDLVQRAEPPRLPFRTPPSAEGSPSPARPGKPANDNDRPPGGGNGKGFDPGEGPPPAA
ncbi:uroporphyrinogen-III synthase [Sphingomonas sp. IC4-52]|uniref:uroporphyrinogen-III synthase n=1 Tax=Sphingomonas sp. IC4-52 TaxID=2887202 RepID=UPI001D12C6CD|nr:uroporphyrinogen-III synthase [Sphingomonas sp. IC4-52]MCC2981192.1 uroporphyrinogen-III synthase [Sphingomonas sp. IC4-52]